MSEEIVKQKGLLRRGVSAQEIRVLAKPLKPAALRSLLAQWRVIRSAAE